MTTDQLCVVRVSDDGELGDVRSLLDELGVDWVSGDDQPERATALWIGNPRRLVAARSGAAEAVAPFRIVVADKLTKTLQRELERERPEFLVSRPIHPAALRLLILHALYVGPERRSSPRVALTGAIRFRTGVFGRPAQLVELSGGGCRMVAKEVPAPGEQVTVVLPRELTQAAVLHLSGRIVAADPAGGWGPGEQACSVAFEDVAPETRRALRALMERVSATAMEPRPERARKQPPAPAREPAAPVAPVASEEPGERRRASRRAYARPVLASGSGHARILIGRDLSSGGMRVAPDADLRVGDEFKLVVYGPAGHDPLLLRARVMRDDGESGCVLGFRDLPPQAAALLEQWTELLPNLGAAPDGGAGTSSVVSERVDDDASVGDDAASAPA